MRLIDADKIIYMWHEFKKGEFTDGVTLQSIINRTPTIDAVKVVRCEDCESYKPFKEVEDFDGLCSIHGIQIDKEFYCQYGKREDKLKNTKVIAAFPACGKTYCFENRGEGILILDSDSSKFSWKYEIGCDDCLYVQKIRNPDFPNNYIAHIKKTSARLITFLLVRTKKLEMHLKKPELIIHWYIQIYL